jgi:hypothetical protein
MAAARQRVLLESAASLVTRTSEGFSPPIEAKMAIFTVDITANPGGAETVTLSLQAWDPASGKWTPWAAWTACTAATNATFQKTLSPFTAQAPGGTNVENKVGQLPSLYRVVATHSAGGSFTYSVGASYS